MKNLNEFFMMLHNLIQDTIGYLGLIVLIFAGILMAYIAWNLLVRSQYSDAAWKIRKKNGKKSIFWYDEYGNKVYHKPKPGNSPKRKRAAK